MKEPSDFELESAVRDWRDRLSQSPQFRAENLNELEAHLRDSIAALRSSRLTDEEAFLIATRRIGCAAALEPEFAKVNAREVWLNRVLWMLMGIQLWALINAVTRLSQLAVTFGLNSSGYPFTGRGLESGGLILVFIVFQLMTVAGLIAAGYWLVLNKPKSVSALQHPALLGVFLGVVVAFVLTTYFSGYFENRLLPPITGPTPPALLSARFLSGIALYAIELIVPAVLTVILLRRQLRSAKQAR